MPSEIQEQLIHTIIKTFNYTRKQANDLFKELMMCVKKRELVNIYFFFSNKIIVFFSIFF
jgi:transient receptor potential cation channel subfamily M protein 3